MTLKSFVTFVPSVVDKFRTRILFLIIGVFLAPTLIAQTDDNPRVYDIELLVFRNLVVNDGGEVWPVDYSDWFEESADTEQTEIRTETAVTWLPKSEFRLTAERNALARSAPYRPIAHLAWRQPVSGRNQAKPVKLPTGPGRPDRAYVEGMVRVAVERYLHLDLNLRLHLPEFDQPEISQPEFNQQPPQETSQAGMAMEYEYGVPEIRLKERRRMRSKELHYFDHPRFGVIALITPYTPPAAVPVETEIPPAAQP